MKLQVYNIMIDLDDEESGMTAISLVEDPAVEKDFICFDKDRKPMQFKVEDEMQHKVTGVAIWANKEIYRYDPVYGEYYVVFTPEAIDKIVHKYAKQGLQNLVDLQHDGKMVDGVVMVEYFIKDSSKGINPAGFEDVDDGSLFVTYKIEDDKLWNDIISPDSEFKGFSIEIYADIVPTDRYVEVNDDEYEDEEFMNWLEELLKALEDADCEIIMESDKKKIKLNSDDDDEDGLWSLNFEEVERSDIAKLVNKGVQINNKDYWVYGIGKDNGTDAAILYNPDSKKYVVMPLKDIKQFEPLKAPVGEFPPLPNEIVDDDNITVQKTIVSDDIPSLLHNRVVTMLAYNDDQPQPHTGYRQVAICAYGITKAGNTAIRAYEMFGDSRSAADGTGVIPDYRMFLLKRVQSLKPMIGTEPWGRDVLDSRYNWSGDEGLPDLFDHITESDFQ